MARIDPDEVNELLKRDHCRQMDMNGRKMKGYITVESLGFDLDKDLEFWVTKCLEFNPKAKSSKRRKKS